MTTGERRDFLRERLALVRERIDRACQAAGRTDHVDLVVVTKTYPASDVELLAELGVRDVAENRDQEAKAKRAEVRARELRWHMIGQLQRNKAISVARWADVVESVDRLPLVSALARGVSQANRDEPLGVLLQVDLDPPGSIDRGGCPADEVHLLAQAVAAHEHLKLQGVMAVAPHPATGIAPERAFAELREVAVRLQGRWPSATTISAGMSDDLEAAIGHGATQVRIGGAILGPRPKVQ